MDVTSRNRSRRLSFKDIDCEKPACNTIPEGRAMVAAAAKYNRVVQIGSQGRSTEV